MFQLKLSTRNTEWRRQLEELAEVLNLLTKCITLAPDVNGFCLLKWSQYLTPAPVVLRHVTASLWHTVNAT